MAITTDQTITIHGVSVGISKPIQTLIANGDFTYAELSKFALVGRHDFVNNVAGVFEPDTYSYMAGTSAAISELEKYPVLNSPTAPGWDSVLYTYFGAGKRAYDNYGKMVLIYNMTSSINNINSSFRDGNTACIVTEFNPRLIKMLGNVYTGNVVAEAGDTGSYTIYDAEGSRSFAWMDDDTAAPFASLCIQNFDDAYYFDFPIYDNIFTAKQNISGNRDSTYVSLNYVFDDYMSTGNKLLSVWCDGGIDDFLVGANYSASFVGVHDMSDDRGDKILLVNYVPYGAETSVKASSLDTALKQLAGCGFYFEVNGTTYKPITEGGIVTGYTADLTKNSEWDLINDVTGNTVPDTPGGGGGGGTPGEWDDMPGSGSSIGALAGARCYICSKTDITNLKSWMSKTEADGGPPDGYDVLSSLISVMAFPINMTPASSGPATAITFTGLKTATDNQLANIASALLCIANSVGATPQTEIKTFTSTATALPSAGNPFTIDLGTCTCPTFYSSDFPFADYDASVELYLPFIGTMSLDTQTVMGNSLHAYMTIDPITGAIYSWCECTKNGSRVVVASGTGAIGVNTPITANQVGMAMAQIKNNAAQARQTAIQSALTIGMGAITGVDKNMNSVLMKHLTSGNKNIAIAGARDYADALSVGAQQASMMALPNAIGANLNTGRANRQIAQANHNSVSGSAGGSTADWSCSYTPYLKIITPDVHRAGEQYEHTYGIPTVLSGTLSTFKGLTFCANPDVSSIATATDQEKQQIFGLLAGGVYV